MKNQGAYKMLSKEVVEKIERELRSFFGNSV